MNGALYNELDPFAASWLENLIAEGHIAHGTVDRRSIADLTPADVAGPGQRHYFAGIAGWSHALRLAGVPDDADIWTGSCPCQPWSAAGKRGGVLDPRHLWPAWFELIRECRPPVIFGEQVASKDGLAWLDLVRSDLEGCGYAFGAQDLPAAGVGAPHIRQRLYFVAYANVQPSDVHIRPRRSRKAMPDAGRGRRSRGMADAGIRDGRRIPGPHGRQAIEPAGHGTPGLLADAGIRDGRRIPGSHTPKQPDSHRDAGVLEHTGSARSRWHPGTVPGTQGEGEGEGREPRRIVDVPLDAGATRGFWADAEWLLCTDGKARPTGSSLVWMVDGLPTDVVPMRSAQFEEGSLSAASKEGRSDAQVRSLQEEDATPALPRSTREHDRIQPTEVLQPIVHGGVDDGSHQGHERPKQPEAEWQGRPVRMSAMRHGQAPSTCSPSGREPTEQQTIESHDVVRLLSSTMSLAKLRSDDRTAKAVLALLEPGDQAGLVQHSLESAQKIWASLGQEVQDRIRLGLERFRREPISPISVGPFSRLGRLRGYGNAIVPELAAEFIQAALEAIQDLQDQDR